MPVVPFTGPQPQTLPMPDEQFVLMAAAQMHGEGRLIATPEAEPPKEVKPDGK